jgi:hypothetical protein
MRANARSASPVAWREMSETFAIKDRRKIGDLGRFDQVSSSQGEASVGGHISGALRTFLADHESVVGKNGLDCFSAGPIPTTSNSQFATHYPKELIAHADGKAVVRR